MYAKLVPDKLLWVQVCEPLHLPVLCHPLVLRATAFSLDDIVCIASHAAH